MLEFHYSLTIQKFNRKASYLRGFFFIKKRIIAMWIEYIGYVGSVLVALSLTMNNIRNLRTINLFGAATFGTYGVLINSYPVMFLNSFIVIIDIYYLYKLSTTKDYFNINDTLETTDFFVHKFLNFHQVEIESFFPNFNITKVNNPKIILVSRNLRPVGMFIYEQKDNGIIKIHLDFAIKDYRDTKNVRYVFMTKAQELKDQGFHTFKASTEVRKHEKYLLKIGFSQADGKEFEKSI